MINDLVGHYRELVSKRIPASSDWDEELNEISYMRERIHDNIDSINKDVVCKIDLEWQQQLVSSPNWQADFTYPREGVDKIYWWAWIDRLGELTTEEKSTL